MGTVISQLHVQVASLRSQTIIADGGGFVVLISQLPALLWVENVMWQVHVPLDPLFLAYAILDLYVVPISQPPALLWADIVIPRLLVLKVMNFLASVETFKYVARAQEIIIGIVMAKTKPTASTLPLVVLKLVPVMSLSTPSFV